MRLRHIASGEEFTVDVIEEGIPDTIAGPLALKRIDTGAYLPVREIFGFDSEFGIVEYSAEEQRRLTARPIIKRARYQRLKCQHEK